MLAHPVHAHPVHAYCMVGSSTKPLTNPRMTMMIKMRHTEKAAPTGRACRHAETRSKKIYYKNRDLAKGGNH